MLRRSHAWPPQTNQVLRSNGVLHILFFCSNSRCFLLIPLSLNFCCADSRNFKLNMNFVELQNLNRILRFEVYAHSEGHSVP